MSFVDCIRNLYRREPEPVYVPAPKIETDRTEFTATDGGPVVVVRWHYLTDHFETISTTYRGYTINHALRFGLDIGPPNPIDLEAFAQDLIDRGHFEGKGKQ